MSESCLSHDVTRALRYSPSLFTNYKALFVSISETPDDLEAGSRSPSPEAHLEESREELLDDDFAEEDPQEEDTCVVAGGYREGWGPVAAVVLWRRVLGILGNVNKIKDPAIHAKVLECLTSIWNMLAKVTFTLNFILSISIKICIHVIRR